MTQTTSVLVMSRPLSLYHIHVYLHCNLCYSYLFIESGNFQKSGKNTYTWNLGMYDMSSDR